MPLNEVAVMAPVSVLMLGCEALLTVLAVAALPEQEDEVAALPEQEDEVAALPEHEAADATLM